MCTRKNLPAIFTLISPTISVLPKSPSNSFDSTFLGHLILKKLFEVTLGWSLVFRENIREPSFEDGWTTFILVRLALKKTSEIEFVSANHSASIHHHFENLLWSDPNRHDQGPSYFEDFLCHNGKIDFGWFPLPVRILRSKGVISYIFDQTSPTNSKSEFFFLALFDVAAVVVLAASSISPIARVIRPRKN